MDGRHRALLISSAAVAVVLWLAHQRVSNTSEANPAFSATVSQSAVSSSAAIDPSQRSEPPARAAETTGPTKFDADLRNKDAAVERGQSEPAIDSGGVRGEISALELEDAKSADGRPFPTSRSVTRACATDPAIAQSCLRLMEVLSELSAEPRDIRWARDMEERIEAAVARPDPGKFTVRAVECRSTHCALEVSANNEYYLGHFDDDPLLNRTLFGPVVGVLAFEKGPDGEKIILTSLAYERR